MSRLHAQLSALTAAGASVHAVTCSALSRAVLWEHADLVELEAADFYVVLRYFTEGQFGEHVGVASVEHRGDAEVRRYVGLPAGGPGAHLGVYVFNPRVCGARTNGPLALEVQAGGSVRGVVVEADTCPLVHTLTRGDLQHASSSLRLRTRGGHDVDVRVYASEAL